MTAALGDGSRTSAASTDAGIGKRAPASGKDDRRPDRAAGPKVLEKALRMLDLFTAEAPSWTVTEVARELELPTATAHRILRALEARGYLMRSHTGYGLGLAAVDLGHRARASIDLRRQLRTVLRELAQNTRETALLTVRDERSEGSLCIDRIETTQSLRLSIEIGRVTPIHAGASAKAMLAFLDDATITEVLDQPLERLGPGTITDPQHLRSELARIRKRGWATSYEENNEGAWGMAAPVLIGERVIASLGFAAPTARYSKATEQRMAKLVLSAARDAEAALREPSVA
jgi:IclR family transcriptional regulator, acetate operon repressor